MLKGLYDFSPISSKTLGFRLNENLLYLSGVDNDGNWLRVSNCKGQIGLVPINYVDANHHVSGSSVVDFLDESLQIARREKSSHLHELQEIRRNILNPINDLERRLKEFQQLIAQLKSRELTFDNKETTSSRSKMHSIWNGSDDREEQSFLNSPPSPSFLTCDDVSSPFQDSNNFPSGGRGFDPERSSVKSKRSTRSKVSSPFIQYVNPTYNSDQEGSRGDPFGASSIKSSYDSDNRSISQESSMTYTCSNGSHNKLHGHKSRNNNNSSRNKSPPRNSTVKNFQPTEVTPMKLCSLIEVVRQCTGISYASSQNAVQVVLQFLKENSQGLYESSVNLFLKQLEAPGDIHQSSSFIRSSADYERLYVILCELSAQAQDDEIWETQDDPSVENVLQEMNTILGAADKRIVMKALEEEGYEHVYNLTLYFQKEHRWSRRKLLIHSFAKMASIDVSALSVLLNSTLPVELAREMMDCASVDKCHRLEVTGSLLGLLLSTGEKLPVRHLEFLGKGFLNFVLDKIDNALDNSGDVTNVLINLLLAYNLQFGFQDDNLTIATLATRRNAKLLTQKIVHLLLWEQDPIAVINQESRCPDSVLKLLLEMFTCSMTADLFYTNDTKVLIDIVIRSLMNWEPGEKKRTLYLQLIRMIIRNSNFREHNHRRDDLMKIFTSILLEEDPLAVQDKRLIREITNEFPGLVK